MIRLRTPLADGRIGTVWIDPDVIDVICDQHCTHVLDEPLAERVLPVATIVLTSGVMVLALGTADEIMREIQRCT